MMGFGFLTIVLTWVSLIAGWFLLATWLLGQWGDGSRGLRAGRTDAVQSVGCRQDLLLPPLHMG